MSSTSEGLPKCGLYFSNESLKMLEKLKNQPIYQLVQKDNFGGPVTRLSCPEFNDLNFDI